MILIDRIDGAILRVEQVVVAAVLGVMGLVVFLDVVTRSVAGRGPLFWGIGLAIGGIVGALAARSRPRPIHPAKGGVAGLALAALLMALPLAFPNGLVWSQPLALALTLWLGTIGASIAAHQRRHLALDIGSKLWPARLQPVMAGIGHVLTGLFCLGLLGLAWRSLFGFMLDGQHVPGHVEVWSSSEGAGGNLSGTSIPKWIAVASILYGMSMLALRFGLEAIKCWTGRVTASGDDDTLHQLGIQGPEEAG